MKKILSSLLLLIFFAGQINLAWAKHFCNDQLVSSELSVNPTPSDCCESDSNAPQDCCKDEITQSSADDFFKKSEISHPVSPEFMLALVITFIGNHELEEPVSDLPAYIPDIPIPDIQALHQTFLI